MVIEKQVLDSRILERVIQILSKKLATEVKISSIQFLSEPERRNRVVRLVLSSSEKTVPSSIILKQSLREETDADDKDAYARFARDWAGLEFATLLKQSGHNVPKFYGGDHEQRFILIEDLGVQHISLVDSLAKADRKEGIAALTRFMKALGSFHAASFGNTLLYEQILRSIHLESETVHDERDFLFADLLPKLDATNKKLGLNLTAECVEEAKSLIEYVLKPGLFTVLTHGDICPDNVFDHAETKDLQLIDFEWCVVRRGFS